jgi:hypothetical protein
MKTTLAIETGFVLLSLAAHSTDNKPCEIVLRVERVLVPRTFSETPQQEFPEWHGIIRFLPGNTEFPIKLGHHAFREDVRNSFVAAICNDAQVDISKISDDGVFYIAEKLKVALNGMQTHPSREAGELMELHQICHSCFTDHLRRLEFLQENAVTS